MDISNDGIGLVLFGFGILGMELSTCCGSSTADLHSEDIHMNYKIISCACQVLTFCVSVCLSCCMIMLVHVCEYVKRGQPSIYLESHVSGAIHPLFETVPLRGP